MIENADNTEDKQVKAAPKIELRFTMRPELGNKDVIARKSNFTDLVAAPTFRVGLSLLIC